MQCYGSCFDWNSFSVSPSELSMGHDGNLSVGVIIGISIGVGIGVLLAACLVVCLRARKKRVSRDISDSRGMVLPIRINGVDSSVILSDSMVNHNVPNLPKEISRHSQWLGGAESHFHSAPAGVTKFTYKELQKATNNFTSIIGQGAFGPVYKAVHSSGVVLAVKALAANSKQGEKEFETEVSLLGRLHHRNLVNLRGFCAERGHRMLVYDYMCNGSLADHLYSQEKEPLEWEVRVQIAQDISRGIEYLHDGAVPPVIHRDIKSANILLDSSMTARVADFGLSKEGSMDEEGKDGWDALLDPRLDGRCNQEELSAMAAIANRCVRRIPDKRPHIRDVCQSLSRISKKRSASKTNKLGMPPIPDAMDEIDESDS